MRALLMEHAVRADLKSANARLLDYVKNGGVLIVQYNLQDFDHNYGPYPFTLGGNPQKVVDENSPVTLLNPSVTTFYLTVLPGFLPPSAGFRAFAPLAAIHITMALSCHLMWALALSSWRSRLAGPAIVRTT